MRTDGDGKDAKRAPTQVRQEIASARADLVETTHALQLALKQKLDWKEHLLARPLAVVGACFALGLLLGYRRRPRLPSELRRLLDAHHETQRRRR